VKNRAFESPGRKPCPELGTRAGIWRYDATKTGQAFSPRERYATGLRNPEALAVQPRDGALYAVVHGRDQLSENWPKLYTVEQQNELPAEILVRITEAPTSVGPPVISMRCRPGRCLRPSTAAMAARPSATAR